MLYNYLNNEIDQTSYSNFIVLGDWNDDLKDAPGEHCFSPFLDDQRYYFLTDRIDDDLAMASYPKEPYFSFLDHILVTKSLLDRSPDFHVETIQMGNYMNDYQLYEKLISDHLPVLLSF